MQISSEVIAVLGPFHTIQAFEDVNLPKKAYLSAYPNASLLDVEDGRVVYESEADYFARAAEELVKPRCTFNRRLLRDDAEAY